VCSRINKTADVAIWGHIPPPYGGMTIHIKRLIPRLRDAGISVQTYNLNDPEFKDPSVPNFANKKFLWLLRLLFRRTEKIHYVISVRPFIRFVAVLFGKIKRKKVILRIGGASLYKSIYGTSGVLQYFSLFALRNADAVIGVNKSICDLAISIGVKPQNVYHVPGFIPPNENEGYVPDKVIRFLNNKSPKLLVTGTLPSDEEYDVYGIKDAIKVLSRLKNHFPHAGLLVYVQNAEKSDNTSFDAVQNIIKGLKANSSVLLYASSDELFPVFKHVDLFLRPTYSDGDANSIREAMYSGLPVAASDCVTRPDGVMTFTTGNIESFSEVLTDVIHNIDYHKNIAKNNRMTDNSVKIIEIIKNLLC